MPSIIHRAMLYLTYSLLLLILSRLYIIFFVRPFFHSHFSLCLDPARRILFSDSDESIHTHQTTTAVKCSARGTRLPFSTLFHR